MKYLITTIAALVLVGCGPSVPDISIHEAAFNGDIEAVKQRLAAGANVNAKHDESGATALSYAAVKGQEEITELLIAKGADVNARDFGDVTPLIHAITGTNRLEIGKILISNGANVNMKMNEGGSALHYLSVGMALTGKKLMTEDDLEVAKLLIQNGADVNAVDNERETPLDVALETNHTEIADLLRKHGAKTGEELATVVTSE
jgi:ankyrin repeat protein